MFEFIHDHFYHLDLIIGCGAPLVVFAISRKPSRRYLWRLFWLGTAIGLTWEVPIFVFSSSSLGPPLIGFTREPPLHFSVFLTAHALWDGGLFLAGVGLIHLICKCPVLVCFARAELIVFLVWGQASALCVELGGILNDAWFYLPGNDWNPVLFEFRDHVITLLPQLIWLVAPVVFYTTVVNCRALQPSGD